MGHHKVRGAGMKDFFRALSTWADTEMFEHYYRLAMREETPSAESDIWAGIAELWGI